MRDLDSDRHDIKPIIADHREGFVKLAAGAICGLIGPNGAGKTTLFDCISRLYDPGAGSMVFDGSPARELRQTRASHPRHRPGLVQAGDPDLTSVIVGGLTAACDPHRSRHAEPSATARSAAAAILVRSAFVGVLRERSVINIRQTALLPEDPETAFSTFAHFTCQRRCALKDRTKENQSLGALDVGAKSTENGLFLASVTDARRARASPGDSACAMVIFGAAAT